MAMGNDTSKVIVRAKTIVNGANAVSALKFQYDANVSR